MQSKESKQLSASFFLYKDNSYNSYTLIRAWGLVVLVLIRIPLMGYFEAFWASLAMKLDQLVYY